MDNDPDHKFYRKTFLQLAATGSLAWYITSCTNNTDKPSEGSVTSDTSKKEISALPEKIHVRLIHKDDADYERLRIGFNKRINKFPAIIALCKTTEEVAEAVKYANANKMKIAIKSGGHCFEGYSSNNDGMVIDLSEMKKVEWNDDQSITVQPGCKLSTLYDEILPKQRIIPAGSCGSVGLGGLTLGGGYGIFSRKLGLTCDSLTALTMVNGNGEIVNVTNDDELLWACRGGGNGNFGVITSFRFKTFRAPVNLQTHYFKSLKLDGIKAAEKLNLWFEACKDLPLDCYSAFVLNGSSLNIILINSNPANQKVTGFVKEFSSFMDKTTAGAIKPLTQGVKNYYGIQHPVYFKNSSAGFYNSFVELEPIIEDVFKIVTGTPGMIFQVNTLGGEIQNPDFEKDSSYPHRSFNFLTELQTYWDEEKQTAHFEKKFAEVQSYFSKHGVNTQYRNYPDADFKDWEHLYYGKNYERLKQVKKKYDPDNIFGYEQGIK